MGEDTGIHFGAYRLLSRLGVGGMGETWRAVRHDTQGVSKDVVIKRILRSFSEDPAFREAFISEARLSARLSHGNVAQVFEFGEVDGEYFMALEYVAGQSLGAALDRARKRGLNGVPPAFAAYVAMEMLKGLHHAHVRSGPDGKPLHIVHRDVSPDNVLLSYEGEVKVVDFGIAKAQLAGRAETEPGVVKGKYLYFAPEQARGEAVDARTDVFATGVVLYAMLAGRLPLEGQAHVVMRKVALGEIPPLTETAPWVPPVLAGLVGKALAPAKEQRFPTALAFQQALAGVLHELAPDASQLLVSGMMAWLFGQELSALGRTVVVPTPVQRLVHQHQSNAVPVHAVPTRDYPAASKATDPAGEAVSARERWAATGETQATAEGFGLPKWVVPVGLGVAVVLTAGAVWSAVGAEKGPPPATPLPRQAPVKVEPRPAAQATVPVAVAANPDGDPEAQRAQREATLAEAQKKLDELKWDEARDLLLTVEVDGQLSPDAKKLLDLMDTERGMKKALDDAEAAIDRGELERAKNLLTSTENTLLLKARRAEVAAKLKDAVEQKVAEASVKPRGGEPGEGLPGDVVRGLSEKGRAYLRARDYSEAKKVLLDCLKVDPKAFECAKLLGSVYAKLGDAELSVKYYRKFLELAPPDHPDRSKVQEMMSAAGR